MHLQFAPDLGGGATAVCHGADGQKVADHARYLGQDKERLHPTELQVRQDIQGVGAAALHDGVGEGEGVVLHSGDGGGADIGLGGGIPTVGADVAHHLVDLPRQGEHIPPAVFHRKLADLGVSLHSAMEVVLLNPARELGGGVALEPHGSQVLGEGSQSLRGLFGEVAGVKGIGGGGEDHQIVGVIGDLGQGLAELVRVGGAESGEIQSRYRDDLALGAHRGDRQGVQQGGGGEVQPVQADVVEGGHSGVGRSDRLTGYADGGGLHVVLLAKEEIASRGGGLEGLAEVGLLENGQGHGLPPPFAALGGGLTTLLGRVPSLGGGLCGGSCASLCGGSGDLTALGRGMAVLGRIAALGIGLAALAVALALFGCGLAAVRRGSPTRGLDQTLGTEADEVGPPCLGKRLADQIGVLGAIELQKGSLELLFVVVGDHVDGLHVQGIDARVEHDGGGGAGGGVVVLDLLGSVVISFETQSQLDGLAQGRAGVAGHEVGNQVLLLAAFLGQLEVFLTEGLIDVEVGLAHAPQDGGGAMLGGHLQLTRHVILHQLAEESIIGVGQEVVEADARADEDLFHLGQSLDGLQKLDVFRVIRDEVGAGLGGEALAIGAHAVL